MDRQARWWAIPLVVAGLVLGTLGPAAGAPHDETAWESGRSATVYDGDTLDVAISESNSGISGTRRVRTIGINAPEVTDPAQCGAAEAKSRLRSLLPAGTPVQLRALSPASYDERNGGRILRSLYAQDPEGNWFDTSRQLVSDGRVLWFPKPTDSATKPEFAHNLEYRVLAGDAAQARRGLWAANSCGTAPSPGAKLRLAVSWDQHSSVHGYEKIFIFNEGSSNVSVGGWIVRDSSLNSHRMPAGATVPARGSIELRLTTGTNGGGVYYLGQEKSWFDNIPAPNPEFVGDAVYLMDDAGPHSTGNLRAWYPYPCEPDDCVDPLKSRVAIKGVTYTDVVEVPSAPRSLHVLATQDGTGDITLDWQKPSNVGDRQGITGYRVAATEVGGAELPTVQLGRTVTEYTWTGLEAGRAYTFTVAARNAQGWSTTSAPSAAVTSRLDAEATGGVYETTGPATPNPPAWAPRETVTLVNTTSSSLALGGYALWDKTPRASTASPGLYTDTPDFVFERTTRIPAQGSLRIRSGTATSSEPASATLVYTGKGRLFDDDDRMELAGLDKAPVACLRTSGAACATRPDKAAPTQPLGITARTKGATVIVSWGLPISRGGTAITGYTATAYADSQGGDPVSTCSTNGSGRTCTLSAAPGRTHHIEVVARNAVGTSAPSTPRVLATPRTPPSAPGSVRVTSLPGAAHVTWTPSAANGAAVESYRAAAFTAETGGEEVGSCTASGATGCTITGLSRKNPRFIEVTATNRIGTGPPSSPRALAAPPGVPDAVSTVTRARRVIARWDAPADGSGVITGYTARVYTKAKGGKRLATCTATAGKTKCRTTKVRARSRYYIGLTTRSQVGDYTLTKRIVTGPATRAGKPTVVSASRTKKRVTITWAPPRSIGYTPLTKYAARIYTKKKKGVVRATCTAGPAATSCTTKKVKKRKYYAAVRVKNKKGWSSWSTRKRVAL